MNNLKIKEEREESGVLLTLSGSLSGAEVRVMETTVTQVLNQNTKNITFDMSGIKDFDSGGLRACMIAFKLLREKKGLLIFKNISEVVQRVFEITRLGEILIIIK